MGKPTYISIGNICVGDIMYFEDEIAVITEVIDATAPFFKFNIFGEPEIFFGTRSSEGEWIKMSKDEYPEHYL